MYHGLFNLPLKRLKFPVVGTKISHIFCKFTTIRLIIPHPYLSGIITRVDRYFCNADEGQYLHNCIRHISVSEIDIQAVDYMNSSLHGLGLIEQTNNVNIIIRQRVQLLENLRDQKARLSCLRSTFADWLGTYHENVNPH